MMSRLAITIPVHFRIFKNLFMMVNFGQPESSDFLKSLEKDLPTGGTIAMDGTLLNENTGSSTDVSMPFFLVFF